MERQKKERNPALLFIGLSLLIITAAYINVTPPASLISLIGFFLLLSIVSTTLGFYLFHHMRHAVILSVGIIIWLILRLIGLRHPLYTVLLIASIIALEYLWKDQGQS